MEFNFNVNPNADALCQSGVEFLKATERCLAMDEKGKITIFENGILNVLTAPAVVNATFACEMFLKCLILKSGNTYPKDKDGHNLKKLFELLTPSIRTEVSKLCIRNSNNPEGILLSFFEEHSKDFVDVRYYATKAGWQGMSPIMVYTYAFNLGNATNYILKNWKDEQSG